MRTLAPALALLLGAAAAQAQVPAQSPTPPPAALVISNSAYAALPKQPACELSANLVAATLGRAGFTVTRQSNPSNAKLGTAIAALGDAVVDQPGARTLIYFCGAVASTGDRLFLLPAEARLDRPTDVLSQGIVARLLMASAAAPASRAGLVLMDLAPAPGEVPPLPFDSMLRPADTAHGGLAAAALPAQDLGPGPLAAALPDLVAGGSLELGTAMQALRSAPRLDRALLVLRPPAQPSWLLGGPPAPAPAPTQAAVATPAPEAKPAAPVPDAAPALAELNPAERRRVQLGLQRLGYYRGRVDGTFGPDTLAAIARFQKDSEEASTGKLTTRQAEQLLQP